MNPANLAEVRAHLGRTVPRPSLKPLTVAEFIALEIPPRELVLAPWLPVKGLAMIFARTGVGKTYLALEASYTAAAGANFLGWQAPMPRKVLYVDGEMPAVALQERIVAIARRYDAEPPPDGFRILSADLHESGLPDLATEEGQDALLEHLGDAELVVLDNLSTLFRSGKENEAESWAAVQPFLLKLRFEGRAVLLVHHAGKGGDQRGTSKRLDVLDSVLRLDRPNDYDAAQGARFIVTYDKARGFYGPEAEPFEAWLDPASACWRRQSVRDARDDEIRDLVAEGRSGRQIARELGMSSATVARKIARLKEDGGRS
jgi:putative DNA primase/helicase